MNLTIYTNYRDAQLDAHRYATETGIEHVVIERLPAGSIVTPADAHDGFVGADIMAAAHRYTVLSAAEWLKAGSWDAEVRYIVPGGETMEVDL